MSATEGGRLPDALPGSAAELLASPYESARSDYSQEDNTESRYRQMFNEHRGVFSRFMKLVSRLPRLREDAVHDGVLARQKRRELGFKRTRVSTSDARFMRAIQTLIAQGKLSGFPELLRLASECQQARDNTGPLEADCNEAEQEWEWRFSKLQLAEASAYEFFMTKFPNTDDLPSPSSSQYGSSSSDSGSQYLEDTYNDTQDDVRYLRLPLDLGPDHSSLLEVQPPGSPNEFGQRDLELRALSANIDQPISTMPPNTGYSYYSSPTLSGDIDRPLSTKPGATFDVPTYSSTPQPLTDIENYPKLLLNFSTVRERVTNWLLHSLLLSRLEAAQLKARLDAEDPKTPSNWAQLVLSWWEKDMATAPDSGVNQQRNFISRGNGTVGCEPVGSITNGVSPLISDSDIGGRGHPFVALLFGNPDMKSFFQIASKLVEKSIFADVFRSLLDHFATAINQEAQDQVEIVASRFIQNTKGRIAQLVKERVYGPNVDTTALMDDICNHDLNNQIGLPLEQLTRRVEDTLQMKYEVLTSFASARNFILKSASFAQFRLNLAGVLKRRIDEIAEPTKYEDLQLANNKKAEASSSTRIAEDISLIAQAPDVNVATAAPLAGLGSTGNGNCESRIPSPNNTEFVALNSENATMPEVTRAAKENGNTKHAKYNHPSNGKSSSESLPSQTTPTPTPGRRIPEKVKQKSDSGDPPLWTEQLFLNTSNETFHRAHKKLQDHLVVDNEEPNSPTRRAKNSEVLGPSPTRPQNRKGSRRSGSLISPTHSPTSAKIYGSSPTRSQNGKRAQIDAPNQGQEQNIQAATRQTHVGRTILKEYDKHEFEFGKIFKVCWSEPKSSGGKGGTVISVRSGTDGEDSKAKIRRFVIIQAFDEHCVCLSIMSGNGRRTSKTEADADAYAIIYTEQQPFNKSAGETTITRPAIRFKPSNPQHKLEEDSRINYAKVYNVEYHMKVCFIGVVSKDSEQKLLTTFQGLQPSLLPRIPTPSLSSATNSTTSGIPDEPQSPPMLPVSGRDVFTHHVVHSGFSQSSGDSVNPFRQQFSIGQRRGEENTDWEATHAKDFRGPSLGPLSPQRVAICQDPSTMKQDTHSAKPQLPTHGELQNDS